MHVQKQSLVEWVRLSLIASLLFNPFATNGAIFNKAKGNSGMKSLHIFQLLKHTPQVFSHHLKIVLVHNTSNSVFQNYIKSLFYSDEGQ